jgi:tetratricopeptide (TPR) repeat protein
MSAQMAVRTGNIEGARQNITEALNLKRNFTQALFLSAQLDIAEGNTDSAIATTRAIITLEPNNPTRYFQLGLLLSAANRLDEAVAAYQAAIRLDPDYANARYLLALAYLNQGQNEPALNELRIVQQTNQDNAQLQVLIEQVESGGFEIPQDLGLEPPVSETEPGDEGFEEGVITEGGVDTDLVTPVNTVSESNSESNEPAVNVDDILESESTSEDATEAPSSE